MKLYISVLLIALILVIGTCAIKEIRTGNSGVLAISEQGSFMVGGTVLRTKGEYKTSHPTSSEGQTLHGDHVYVFYQIPKDTHVLPIIFLHGAGQSSKTWETTPDGREGFQTLFLRRGFPTYLVDQPRRGKAGRSLVSGEITAEFDEQLWFEQFRLGQWPNFYPGIQFSDKPEALEQFFRQMTPNIGTTDKQVVADGMTALFNKIGKGILVTHSQGGGPGWRTAMQSYNVKAVIALEPGSSFVFPIEETPAPIETNSPFGALAAESVTLEEFIRLTKIPIIIYYGDNIPSELTGVWGQDGWAARLKMARLWADCVNRHGGDATVIHLPEIGIRGNTHFLMSDLNNMQIANLMYQWLHEKNLDQ